MTSTCWIFTALKCNNFPKAELTAVGSPINFHELCRVRTVEPLIAADEQQPGRRIGLGVQGIHKGLLDLRRLDPYIDHRVKGGGGIIERQRQALVLGELHRYFHFAGEHFRDRGAIRVQTTGELDQELPLLGIFLREIF
jgi:hypothetical protein